MMRFLNICLIVLLAMVAPVAEAAESEAPPAPEWSVSEWFNGPPTTLADLRGKVVVIEFFQLWCPGCNRFSIPLMQAWQEKTFKDAVEAGDLVVVSIHTVFEGHGYQTVERLRGFLKKKGITHLVGHDRHEPGDHRPVTKRRYNTGGTPEVAIVDKRGRLRFQEFGGFNTDTTESLIRDLLAE